MERSALLIEEAKQALVSPGDAESQQRLAQVSGGGCEPMMMFAFSDELKERLSVNVDEIQMEWFFIIYTRGQLFNLKGLRS